MSNKRIRNRLDKLFDGIKQDEDVSLAVAKEVAPPLSETVQPYSPPVSPKVASPTRSLHTRSLAGLLPPETETIINGDAGSNASMSLMFQTQEQDWNTLQVIDEVPGRVFGTDEQTLVKQVVDQLTLALQNAHLFQQTERQAGELSILNEMGRDLAAQLNVSQIVESVYRYSSQLMDTDNFFVALFDQDRDELSFPIVINGGVRIDLPVRKLSNSLTDWVIRNKRPLFIPEKTAQRREELGIEQNLFGDERPAVCWLGVPIMLGERVLGVITVQSARTERLYDDHHRDLLISVASQTAIAVQNAHLFQQTQQQNAELAVLNELGRELSGALTTDGIAKAIYSYAGKLMNVESFFIALLSPNGEELEFPLVINDNQPLKDLKVKSELGLTGYMLRTRQPLLISENVSARMKEFGIDEVIIGDNKGAESWLGVPINIGQQVLGAMVVQSTATPHLYTEHQRDLLVAIAGSAAISIQNARLFQETARRNEELASLNEIISSASLSLDISDIFKRVLEKVLETIDLDAGLVSLFNPTSGRLELTSSLSLPEKMRTKFEIEGLKDTLCDYVYQNNQALTVDDLSKDAPVNVSGVLAAGFRSYIGVPLEIKGVIEGTLCAFKNSPFSFQKNTVELMRTMGRQIGFVIENSRLFEETQKRANELSTLNEIVRSISEQIELKDVLEAAYQQIRKIVKTDAFLVALHDAETNIVNYPFTVDDGTYFEEPSQLLEPDTFTGRTITSGEYFLELLTPEEAEHKHQKFIGNSEKIPLSTLFMPLKVGIKTIGVVSVQSYSYNAYKPEDITLLQSVANQLVVGIQNALLFDQTRQSQAELSQALKIARMGYVEFDLLKQQFVLNDDYYGLLDTSIEQEGSYALALDDFAKRFMSSVDQLGKLGEEAQKAFSAVPPQAGFNVETEMITRTGKLLWFLNEFTIFRDQNGLPSKVAGSAQDITERKAYEQRLQRQNAYLSTAAEVGRLVTSTLDVDVLFNRSVDLIRGSFGFYYASIFTIDDNGFNAYLREGTGDAGQEMKRTGHSLAVGSRSIIGQVTATGKTIIINNTALEPMHKNNPLLPDTRAEAGIPLRAGERIIGAIDLQSNEVEAFKQEDIAVLEILADQIAVAIENAHSYDVSQKAVEEMRELDRIKSQFLANMSHELRTPLNSIIGFSRVILKGIDGPINEQQQQDLGAIYNSGQHLLGLINDILDLSKIEAGKMELAIDEINMVDTIHSVMSTAMGLVKDKSVRLKEDIEPDLPMVRADPMRLRQILINLLSNAAKFTEEGSIIVNAKVHTTIAGKREVMVSVTDSGPGISAEDQKKLFQAFSQVDSSPTRKTGGTGLGLSICQQLVKLHGGRIGIHSQVGKGSTFYFTIPVFDEEPEIKEENKGNVVLCIDDDAQVISLYERYLIPRGYQVIALTDPTKARETVKRIKPYAITLDIMMPGYDGWQVIADLKSDPETHAYPVIVCSIVEEEEKGFSLGAADYLVKPILEDDLIDAMNRLNSDGSIQEILVIDDDIQDLRLIEKIFTERSQFKLTLAEGGQKGWEMLEERQPHAIILDLFMPDVNGFTILERLRTTPKLRDIPVIVVSGVDLNQEQRNQLENLGKRLLQKGMLNEEELFATLERALKRLEIKQGERL